MTHTLYQILLIGLLVAGFALSSLFIAQFRPRQWLRAASWDAVGWIIIVWLWYARSLAVIAIRWPNIVVPGVLDGIVSIALLIVLDVLLTIRVVSFWRFRSKDRAGKDDAQVTWSAGQTGE